MKPSNLQTPKPIARLRSSRQMQTEATPIVKRDKVVSRSLDADFTAESAMHRKSDLVSNQTKKLDKIEGRLSDSDFTAESELLLSDLPDPIVASPAESVITEEEPAHHQILDLIKKALEETSRSDDISESSKKIIDAMFEAAIDQLKSETGTKINRSVPTDSVRVGTLVLLIILLMWLILVRLINVCSMEGPDWPNGLPPT